MKSKRKILLFLSVICLAVSLGAALLAAYAQGTGSSGASDSGVGIDGLFTGTGVSVEMNAQLPAYMEKISWNGQTYSRDEITAVRIQTDGKSKSATIRYNRVIDLSSATAARNLFDFIIAPQNQTEYTSSPVEPSYVTDLYETRYFHVRFTDVNDENIWMSFDFERRPDYVDRLSMRVSTSSQESAGWVSSSGALRGSPYGTPLASSFTGSAADASGNYNVVSTAYDYAERAVYGYPHTESPAQIRVRGLADPAHLLEGDNLFGGFTTGEVICTFEFDTVTDGKSASIYLFALNGQAFTGSGIRDTTSPEIRVDAAEDDLPLAEAGTEYRIFPATAYDLFDGKLDAAQINATVFFGYNTDAEREMPVSDGCFLPDRAGEYTIVYAISDAAGNIGTREVKIEAQVKLLPLVLQVDGYALADTYEVGDTISIPSSITVIGGSGAYQTEIYVYDHAERARLETSGSISFGHEGYYTLVYRVTDYLGREKYCKYTLKAEARKNALVQMPALPSVVLAGKRFVLPEFSALDYTSFAGYAVQANKSYLVSFDGWDSYTTMNEGDAVVPEAGKKLELKFRAVNIADSNRVYESEAFSIDVIEVSSAGDYFYDKSGAAVLDYTDPETPMYRTETDTSLEFANKLSFRSFSLSFSVPDGGTNFTKINLIFRDTEGSGSAAVSIQKKNNTACDILLNGKQMAELNTAFNSVDGFRVSVSDRALYINSLYICDLNAENESWFAGGFVYFGMGFEGVTGSSAIRVNSINNQTYLGLLDDGGYDYTPPAIVLESELGRVYSVGDVITVPAAVASDVLDPETTISVTVRKGMELIYSGVPDRSISILVTGAASYTVTYSAEDSSGNRAAATHILKAYNKSKPTITLSGNVPATADRGNRVSLPAATAVDYRGESIAVMVYVIDPIGMMTRADNAFTADQNGTYVVRYYCADEDFAYAILEFTISVGE